MRKPTLRRTAALSLALALVASLGACGVKTSNDLASGSATPPTTTAGKTTTTETTTTETTTTEVDETITTEGETTTTAAAADTSRRDYIRRLAAALVSKDKGDLPITDAQSVCLAPRWVAILGYDKLVGMDVSPEQLGTGNGADTSSALDTLIGRPEARQMVAAFGLCKIDLQQAFVDSIGDDSGLTDAQKTCLVNKLPAGYIDKLLVISLADGAKALNADTQLSSTLTNAVQACQ